MSIEVSFTVLGGRYEGDQINWKYIDRCTSAPHLLRQLNLASEYPVSRVQLVVKENNRVASFTVLTPVVSVDPPIA